MSQNPRDLGDRISLYIQEAVRLEKLSVREILMSLRPSLEDEC